VNDPDDATTYTEQPGTTQAKAFVTTHWSVVLSAQEKDSAHAVKAPNFPHVLVSVVCHVRRAGRSHDAEDLTQEFFARFCRRTTCNRGSRKANSAPLLVASAIPGEQ
jgi:hypothetical protein